MWETDGVMPEKMRLDPKNDFIKGRFEIELVANITGLPLDIIQPLKNDLNPLFYF